MAVKTKPGKDNIFFSKDDDLPSLTRKQFKRRKMGRENYPGPSWTTDDTNTAVLFHEMGVGQLSEDSDSVDGHPPPAIYIPDVGLPSSNINQPHSWFPAPMTPSSQGSTATPADTVLSSQENILQIGEDFGVRKPSRPSDRQNDLSIWSRLSDEVILRIFEWLPKHTLARCAKVCKRWNTLVFDETLWKRLDLANKVLGPGVLGRILDRGVDVLRLSKAEVQFPVSIESPTFTPCKLQYLDLSMASAHGPCLREILVKCRQLKRLSLENLAVNQRVCSEIGANTDLEVLNMCMCKGVTELALLPIINGCHKLSSLNVAWCGLTRGAVQLLVLSLPPGLLKLNISGCRDRITDQDVLHLVRTCPNLQELDLSDSTVVTRTSVEHISSNLRELEYIALSRCYQLAPNSLPTFGQCPVLLAMDVFGMMKEHSLDSLRAVLQTTQINKYPFSSIARPTTGIRRTSVWGLRVRDWCV